MSPHRGEGLVVGLSAKQRAVGFAEIWEQVFVNGKWV
jgi:hypothetical protein